MEWSEVQIDDSLRLRLVASSDGIRAIDFHCSRPVFGSRNDANALIVETVRQLRAYFERRLRRFDIPLDLEGTDFQKRVWRQLETIPYGETRSYSQIAAAIGASRAIRATGAANGANPAPIVVPCHRVIGVSGKLVGYGGGLLLKQRLLQLEGALSLAIGI